MPKTILKPKHNCWCIRKVDQMTLLINSQNYYKALFNVMPRARKTISIAGWDLASMLNLRHFDSSFPNSLKKYFSNLLHIHEDLKIIIHCWKPSFYLRFNRDFMASLSWKEIKTNRMAFHHDRRKYLFSSFHEKVVIIDNQCAFLGGIDLVNHQWDETCFPIKEELQEKKKQENYFQTHDLQIVMTGDIILCLNDILKKRFRYAIDNYPITIPQDILWPHGYKPDIRDIPAAIARTEPEEHAYEIENFYLDAINEAKDFIYIENQYLTHQKIIQAICKRLQEINGPEVIILQPFNYLGIFERAVFGHQRNQSIRKLTQADKFERLILAYPCACLKDTSEKKCVLIHSKLMIIDNQLMTIGSANLNYRSMRLDSEINLCIDSSLYDKEGNFIKNSLMRLLSEHLGQDIEELENALSRDPSIYKLIRSHMGKNEKTLKGLQISPISLVEMFLSSLTKLIDLRHSVPIYNFLILSSFLIITSIILLMVYYEV